MKNRYLLVAFIAVLMTALVTSCTLGTQEKSWQLIWQDEFNTDGLPDSDNWAFAGRGKADWKCYCTDDPQLAFVENGLLYLKGVVNENPEDLVAYNTACISTKGKFDFLYGKVEVRAKLSTGKGSWPAIWMMPSDSEYGGWPKSGEIDIMEHLNFDSFVYQTLHTDYTYNRGLKTNPDSHATAAIKTGDFNVYGLEWYPDRLDFYVNEELSFSYPRIMDEGHSQWPFDKPFYIILNQALGGNWVGDIHDEDLPVQMVVDWVRVYQKQ
jgi:beta-glucanase (GH16 family)